MPPRCHASFPTAHQSIVHSSFVAVRLLGQDVANVFFAAESAEIGSRINGVVVVMIRLEGGRNSRLLRHFTRESRMKTLFFLDVERAKMVARRKLRDVSVYF